MCKSVNCFGGHVFILELINYVINQSCENIYLQIQNKAVIYFNLAVSNFHRIVKVSGVQNFGFKDVFCQTKDSVQYPQLFEPSFNCEI